MYTAKKLALLASITFFTCALHAGGDPFVKLQEIASYVGKSDLKFERCMTKEAQEHACKELKAFCHPDKHFGKNEEYTKIFQTLENLCAEILVSSTPSSCRPAPAPTPAEELLKEKRKKARELDDDKAKKLYDQANAAFMKGKKYALQLEFENAQNQLKIAIDFLQPIFHLETVWKKESLTLENVAQATISSIKHLEDTPKKLQNIADSLESGTMRPDRDSLGRPTESLVGGKSLFKPFSLSWNAEIDLNRILSNVIIAQAEFNRKTDADRFYKDLSFMDIIFFRLKGLLAAIKLEAETSVQTEREARSRWFELEKSYKELKLPKSEQHAKKKIAYFEALLAERNAIDTAKYFKTIPHVAPVHTEMFKELLDQAKKEWREAAKIATEPTLKADYEQRALDLDDPTKREQMIAGTYKKAVPPEY